MLTPTLAVRPIKVATPCVASGPFIGLALSCGGASRNLLAREKKAKNVASTMDFGFGG
jgi:hypothetical protein